MQRDFEAVEIQVNHGSPASQHSQTHKASEVDPSDTCLLFLVEKINHPQSICTNGYKWDKRVRQHITRQSQCDSI